MSYSPQITFCQLDRSTLGVFESDVQEVKSCTLPRWMVRLVNWILRRWFFSDERIMRSNVITTKIDMWNVEDAIHRQQDLMAMIYNGRCRDVLMGPKQLRILEHQCEPFMFAHTFPIGGPHGIQYHGINIHVVPWLDGVVAMPEQFKISSS